jgi:hypothetical protein
MRLKLLSIILLVLAVNFNLNSYHAIYIAVVEINHRLDEDTAELKLKIFRNDFESALKNEFQKDIRFESDSVIVSQTELIETYFVGKLDITVNQNNHQIGLIGANLVGESIVLNFELPCQKKWQSIKIYADLLMELFPTQSNIISITNGTDKQFLKLSVDNKSGVVNY